tara:strand:+ start:510 stop:1151 length:642 start_codon:yes stop_codon:yes gene_type:complete
MKTPFSGPVVKLNLDDILKIVVQDHSLHSRWLLTLSYLENCGARKISDFQSIFKGQVPLSILQHAWEESRHAFFMKKQISKLGLDPDEKRSFLGGTKAKNLLYLLDVKILKLLKENNIKMKENLYYGAYLLTTYAIENRADSLYGTYQKVLEKNHSKINLKLIIKEEENHLREIEEKIDENKDISLLKEKVIEIESDIFSSFISSVEEEIFLT